MATPATKTPPQQQLPAHKITIEKLPLKSLQVSLQPGVRTQREAKPERVKKLAAVWDVNVAGVLIVNRRSAADGGGDFVVDGWGRRCAGLAAGTTHLRCEVHHGLPIAYEARLFDLKNDKITAVSILDRYLVNLTEGVPTAVDTEAVLQKRGLTMGGSGPDNIGSVAAVLKVTEAFGASVLDSALGVAEGAWGRDPKGLTWDGSIISGLARLIHFHPQIKLLDVITKLQSEWAVPQLCKGEIQMVATSGGAHYDGSGGRSSAAYRVFVGAYNKGRQKKNRLTPVSS